MFSTEFRSWERIRRETVVELILEQKPRILEHNSAVYDHSIRFLEFFNLKNIYNTRLTHHSRLLLLEFSDLFEIFQNSDFEYCHSLVTKRKRKDHIQC